MNAVELQFVEQGEYIARQLLDGVRTGRDRGVAVAASVVAQDTELLLERRRLRIPHGESSAERIRKNERGRAGGACKGVMDANIFQLREQHEAHFFRVFFWSRCTVLDARTRSMN